MKQDAYIDDFDSRFKKKKKIKGGRIKMKFDEENSRGNSEWSKK